MFERVTILKSTNVRYSANTYDEAEDISLDENSWINLSEGGGMANGFTGVISPDWDV